MPCVSFNEIPAWINGHFYGIPGTQVNTGIECWSLVTPNRAENMSHPSSSLGYQYWKNIECESSCSVPTESSISSCTDDFRVYVQAPPNASLHWGTIWPQAVEDFSHAITHRGCTLFTTSSSSWRANPIQPSLVMTPGNYCHWQEFRVMEFFSAPLGSEHCLLRGSSDNSCCPLFQWGGIGNPLYPPPSSNTCALPGTGVCLTSGNSICCPPCEDPRCTYSSVGLWLSSLSGGYKPILRAANVEHALSSDNLLFGVTCTVGHLSTGTGPGMDEYLGICGSDNANLRQGMHFTLAQLLAGIDLNSFDSVNAPILGGGSGGNFWKVRLMAHDISNCPAGAYTCWDDAHLDHVLCSIREGSSAYCIWGPDTGHIQPDHGPTCGDGVTTGGQHEITAMIPHPNFPSVRVTNCTNSDTYVCDNPDHLNWTIGGVVMIESYSTGTYDCCTVTEIVNALPPTHFIRSVEPTCSSCTGNLCDVPGATYTGLALTQETTTGSYRKPILTATSVSHSLGSDTSLRFWVNCMLGTADAAGPNTGPFATFGPPECSSGGDLLEGMLFTYAELQAGIDLLAHDSVNAAAQDCDAVNSVGWNVRCTAVNISHCGALICADTNNNVQALLATECCDAVLYTGGTGQQFPAFDTTAGALTLTGTGASVAHVLQIKANVNYYLNSTSLGNDSYGATDYKIEIQYDTSCNSFAGCGSYNWQDGIDNDTYLTAGAGGTVAAQTFDVVEANCWSEEYIHIRYRIILQDSCGTPIVGTWQVTASPYNVVSEGTSCGP